MPGQALHEVLDGAALESRGHEALNLDIAQLELEAHLAAEDDELAGDVHPGEVIARVGLRIASLARIADDIGERRAAVIDVEEIRQRSREDALDARDLIPGLSQVPQGMNDRQPRADRRFVQVMRAAGAACLAHGAEIGQVRAVGLLVGCHDVHAGAEPGRIPGGDVGARGAVDDDRMRQVIDVHVLDEAVEVGRSALPLVLRAPALERDPGLGEHHALGAENAAHPQVDLELLAQPRALRGELIQKHPPYRAGSDDTDRERMR